MKCRCGNEHRPPELPPFTYHRVPWAVKKCDGTYCGEWREYQVGPNILSAWKAVVAVIYFTLTGKIWGWAFASPLPTHEPWRGCAKGHHLCRRGNRTCAADHGSVMCCRCGQVYCRWVIDHEVPDDEFDEEHDD